MVNGNCTQLTWLLVCLLMYVHVGMVMRYEPLFLQVGKSYSSAREAIVMTGSFLLEQLQGMDNAAGGKATFAFGGTPFAASLRSEVSISRAGLPAAVQ